jgi:hypothetical protein
MAQRYISKNGCVYRTFEDGSPPLVISRFAPNGFSQRSFADPEANKLAQIAADALNAAEQVSA